jgi:hypothetical protein
LIDTIFEMMGTNRMKEGNWKSMWTNSARSSLVLRHDLTLLCDLYR